ncbi:ATP-binding protein [Gemmiger formicilis]|uniref:RNA-binding domain-containing protein n=1 Tax=Gemmiger formicilis TaxID=745368 RepID=UPI0019563E84|nr:ATP-binding protein [Gemmiger formicilis]
MVNINGKEWCDLNSSDIQAAISKIDFDESFYFELKRDEVQPKKIAEEVSAFSNSFGGYIFLGVSDDKKIEGCSSWNEQRIHTTMHDCITPTPSFDVKRFILGAKTVFVIKIDEGSEPPYITNHGKIYERISSGSCVIKDSSKLSQIYIKREQQLEKMEKKISIPPIPEIVSNTYGYIDIGFVLISSDDSSTFKAFCNADLKALASRLSQSHPFFNLAYIGQSIIFTPGGLTTSNGPMPAHTNNFLEIMDDGSARMRLLLINNNTADSSVNMMAPLIMLMTYQDVYTAVMGTLFPHKMAYAKKYESLTVRKQFQPVLLFDNTFPATYPGWEKDNKERLEKICEHRKIYGITSVITDDRIPKTGLYTIDQRQLLLWEQKYTADAILSELFYSRFIVMGHFPKPVS